MFCKGGWAVNKLKKADYIIIAVALLIIAGIVLSVFAGSKNASGTVQSQTFKFSVADKEVARKLIQMTGLRVTVHYKEYKGALPWRGYERAVVDSVNEEPAPDSTLPAEDHFFL